MTNSYLLKKNSFCQKQLNLLTVACSHWLKNRLILFLWVYSSWNSLRVPLDSNCQTTGQLNGYGRCVWNITLSTGKGVTMPNLVQVRWDGWHGRCICVLHQSCISPWLSLLPAAMLQCAIWFCCLLSPPSPPWACHWSTRLFCYPPPKPLAANTLATPVCCCCCWFNLMS